MKNRLSLHQLELEVYLGWTDGERASLQTIWLDIILEFNKEIKACQTDDLQDTFCYDALITTIKNALNNLNFRLIEHLGYKIYHLIQQNVSACAIHISITKKPAIENLRGGVRFEYGD